jgi:hypothetical protein
MTINLHTLGLSGTILVWLGASVCVLSLALFIAVSSGIREHGAMENQTSEGPLTFQHQDFIVPTGTERLMFLLPLAAGMMLAASGVFIRSKIPEYREIFPSIGGYFESEPSRAGGENTSPHPVKESEPH